MWHAGYRASQYYTTHSGQQNDPGQGGINGVEGDCFWYPLLIQGPSSIDVTKIALINDTTTANNMRWRWGIYSVAADMKPDSLLVDAGTVTKGTTAAGTPVDTSASPFTAVTLTRDTMYYVVGLCEVTHNSANYWGSVTPGQGWAASPFGQVGELTPDAGDYSVKGSNNMPILEGVTASGSMPSSFSSYGYPEFDESTSKKAPAVLIYVNAVTV